jgi:hypothetical protein
LFSLITAVHLVNLVEANFVPVHRGVRAPDDYTKPPIISMTSPENDSVYDTNNVQLTFNVSVGESTSAFSKWICELYYKGDWQTDKTYIDLEEFYGKSPAYERSSLLPSEFSFNLTDIPEGNHSITVYANETGYVNDEDNAPFYYWSFFINSSATVNFTIDAIPEPLILCSTYPMEYGYAIVAATVTVAAIAGYLFWKIIRQRPKQNATVNK